MYLFLRRSLAPMNNANISKQWCTIHFCFIIYRYMNNYCIPFGDQFWAGSNYWAFFKVIVYSKCTDQVRIKIVSIFNAHDTCEMMCGILVQRVFEFRKISMETQPVRLTFESRGSDPGVPVSVQIVHYSIMAIKLRSALYCPIIGSPLPIYWCRDRATEIGHKIVKNITRCDFF